MDLSALPKEVRDQLAELDLELSEGKTTDGGRREGEGLCQPGRRDALARVPMRASRVSRLFYQGTLMMEGSVLSLSLTLSASTSLPFTPVAK